jgi:hypothetical protein
MFGLFCSAIVVSMAINAHLCLTNCALKREAREKKNTKDKRLSNH